MKKLFLALAVLAVTVLAVFAVLVFARKPNHADLSMVLVQGGTFSMGSNNGETVEAPAHGVTLSSFYIARTEVTQAQWKTVMDVNPSHFKVDSKPVEYVSWYDAIVFCNKLSMLDGRTPVYSVDGMTDPSQWDYTPCIGGSVSGSVTMNKKANGYRLPTEAEWEFASRGGNKSNGYTYSGSDILDDVAWYPDNSGYGTHDVATKQANELELYDMTGNVCEWCWDWFGYYTAEDQIDPAGASSGEHRIHRGGGWLSGAPYSRTAYRSYDPPDYSEFHTGFRVVCSK